MADPHTPTPWQFGVRPDGSMWLCLGDPRTGPHWQGELVSVDAVRLILATCEEAANHLYAKQDMDRVRGMARAAIAKAVTRG